MVCQWWVVASSSYVNILGVKYAWAQSQHWAAGFSVSSAFTKEYAKRNLCFPNACFSLPPVSLRNKLYLPYYQLPVTASFPPSWLLQIQIWWPHPPRPHLESMGRSRAGPGDTPFQGPCGVPLHPQSPWALGWVLKLTPSHWLFLVRSLTFTSPDTVFKPRQFSDILGIPTARILAHSFKERQFSTTNGAADEAQPPPKELPSIWCWTRLPWCLGFSLLGGRKSSFLHVQSYLMTAWIPTFCVCVVVVLDLASSFFLLFISYFHWGCYPSKLKSQMTV